MTARDTPGVIAPPPLIFLGFLAAGWGLSQVLPDPGLPLDPDIIRYLAFALIAGGILLEGASAGQFRQAGTRPEPWKPTTAVASGGVYRFSRNPMYLGFALLYAGIAVALNSLYALALLVPCLVIIDLFVIRREERYLSTRFGADYDAYRKRVRRWL